MQYLWEKHDTTQCTHTQTQRGSDQLPGISAINKSTSTMHAVSQIHCIYMYVNVYAYTYMYTINGSTATIVLHTVQLHWPDSCSPTSVLHISAQTSNNTQYAAIRCSIYAYTYEYINCMYVCALYACRVQCCTSMIHSLKRLFTQRFVFPGVLQGHQWCGDLSCKHTP